MLKKSLKILAENPKFISGIYNYCDRWCERCSFTSRCMNFAISEDIFPGRAARDINNKLFWQKLDEIFRETLDMLKEIAEEEGIDLKSLDTEDMEDNVAEETARNHECSISAKAYGGMVDKWFDSAKELFREKEDELILKEQLEIPNSNPLEEADNLNDAVEVIRWYQHQIYVKLMRAIHGDMEEKLEILDEFPRDSDGSAKVALIAIDRSIAAWGKMRKYFHEREDNILDMLVHLDRLRRGVEKTFPNARAFIRPGFDEVDHEGFYEKGKMSFMQE